MENIQERGLRLVFGDHLSNYEDLLRKSNRNLLFIDRLKNIILFVYRCIGKLSPEYLHDMYDKKDAPYQMRDSSKLHQPKVQSTLYGLRSIRYEGSTLWNNLPVHLKECLDFNSFKLLVKAWEGPQYKCNMCTLCKLK